MANSTLQAESADENTPEQAFREAHAAWRRAKAEWELAQYAPGMWDQDLPREEDERLSSAACGALDAYLKTPSPTLGGFVWKLRAFQEEEIYNNTNVEEVVGALIGDAVRLNLEARHGK